jgi:hypothetical protein
MTVDAVLDAISSGSNTGIWFDTRPKVLSTLSRLQSIQQNDERARAPLFVLEAQCMDIVNVNRRLRQQAKDAGSLDASLEVVNIAISQLEQQIAWEDRLQQQIDIVADRQQKQQRQVFNSYGLIVIHSSLLLGVLITAARI